jgi:class 3 adenylate cyclase
MSQTRRLAAILAADVAGYSRLIGADEEGTLNRLRSIRADVIDPKITEHRGRIVKTTGDGLLVEFSSVVDALRCATQWQSGMAERNADAPPTNRIEFRIGINVGDIVVEDDDIFGDGENVAARLEGLADPGGICVSARVQEDVAGVSTSHLTIWANRASKTLLDRCVSTGFVSLRRKTRRNLRRSREHRYCRFPTSRPSRYFPLPI